MGLSNPATTLLHYARWLPTGDKRWSDRLEAARLAVRRSDAAGTSIAPGAMSTSQLLATNEGESLLRYLVSRGGIEPPTP
jgi:hypothetical protein